jgi:hypothetical protein
MRWRRPPPEPKPRRPLALTDGQLGAVMTAARSLPVEKRSLYLDRIAAGLTLLRGGRSINDADVSAAVSAALAGLIVPLNRIEMLVPEFPARVAEYASAIRAGKEFPAIRIRRMPMAARRLGIQEDYRVVDGVHRVHAALAVGRAAILARIVSNW